MRNGLHLIGSICCLLAMSGPARSADTPPVSPHALAVAPPVAPAAPTLDAAGEGRRLYLRLNCYGCHGMAAAGGMGPNIVHTERAGVAEALRQGSGGGMRSFRAYVNDVDITNIAAYLRSIGTAEEPTFRDWWVPVPTK